MATVRVCFALVNSCVAYLSISDSDALYRQTNNPSLSKEFYALRVVCTPSHSTCERNIPCRVVASADSLITYTRPLNTLLRNVVTQMGGTAAKAE